MERKNRRAERGEGKMEMREVREKTEMRKGSYRQK